MSILTLGSKKKGGEGKFPIKEEAKKERRKISNQRKKREEREFPIKEWEKAKRKERKFPIKEWEKEKREEEREESSRSKKIICRKVFGLDNI